MLAAARAAFGAEGSDVSLDEIARRAGVGPGTVYRHFATKEALFEAVVFDRIGELVQEARILSDDPDPGHAFSTFVERLGREGARKRDLVEALASDGVQLQLGGAPIVRALTEVLAELLRRAQLAGAVRADISVDDVLVLLTGVVLCHFCAQLAGAVRTDISVDDVLVLLTGVAYTICHSRAGDARTRQLLAIMYDGLRADRPAEDVPSAASSKKSRSSTTASQLRPTGNGRN